MVRTVINQTFRNSLNKLAVNITNTSSIVSKVWSFCNPLRDVVVGYGDYLEQLTYLLFLKMADEYSKPPPNRKLNIPKTYNWDILTSKKGAELELHYAILLRGLSTPLAQMVKKSERALSYTFNYVNGKLLPGIIYKF